MAANFAKLLELLRRRSRFGAERKDPQREVTREVAWSLIVFCSVDRDSIHTQACRWMGLHRTVALHRMGVLLLHRRPLRLR